jgi:preprotein translocase subunit SecF
MFWFDDMKWASATPSFTFMRYRRESLIASGVLSVVAVVWLIFRGLNLGFDFTGGVLVDVAFTQAVEIDELRSELAATGFESAQLQAFGSTSEVLIRLPPTEDGQDANAIGEDLLRVLRTRDPGVVVKDLAVVGPQIGQELVDRGGVAILIALIMIFLYVMLRFEWKFAVGAVLATAFDVVATASVVALVALPFDLTTLGAILAVMGYSLNDKIVVYDRIRDNFKTVRRDSPMSIVDLSINQTLARTLVTGVSSLLVLLALLFVGGDTLRSFSIALIVGILIGTLVTIFVACPVVLGLNVTASDFASAKRRQVDDLP